MSSPLLQLWVNLPRSEKWLDPRYQGLEPRLIARLAVLGAGIMGGAMAGPLVAAAATHDLVEAPTALIRDDPARDAGEAPSPEWRA